MVQDWTKVIYRKYLRKFGMENFKVIQDASTKLMKAVDNDTDIDQNCTSQL